MKILALLALAFTLAGCGKYPSKQQAEIACKEWAKNGPKYYSKADYSDISARKRWERTGSTRRPWQQSSFNDSWQDEMAKNMKKVGDVWVHGLSSYRSCGWERETSQFLGYQPSSTPNEAIKDWDEIKNSRKVVKNFRY